MPRVKLDYIVSVSSEDPQYQANNLLAGEVTKKKWLCSKNEQTCSVVLQLARAVTISAVHIGAQHAAFVEVLVGSSEKPNDQYEVLVPRCVFCTPAESRRSEPVPRVRSFSGAQLAESARRRCWDRVRVCCTQPYNKHCQFGLSFIHIFEPERILTQPTTESESTPSQLLALKVKNKFLTLGNYSSDDDDFQPGELFAKHRQQLTQINETPQPSSTDAQIRQASSQALNNVSDEATKLKKTGIARSSNKREDPECTGGSGDAEAVVRRRTPSEAEHGRRPLARTDNRKRKRCSGERGNEAEACAGRSACGAAAEGAGRALRGVVFAMSGYVHPERAALREAGLALGARYRPDWAPDCTHLVCAFPNTPKMKKVVAGAAHAHVVGGGWLRECSARGRRLPEAPYSLRAPAPAPAPAAPAPAPAAPAAPAPPPDEHEEDTDDEIEKVRARSRRARVGAPAASPSRDHSDVVFVCDERIKGSVSLTDSDDETTEEEGGEEEKTEGSGGELPDLLGGRSVLIAEEVCAAGLDAALLSRYVRAYGGLPLREEEAEEDTAVDYALCASGAGAQALRVRVRVARLRADWLWGCHGARALLPARPYALPARPR